MKKRLIAIFLLFLITLSLTGCGGNETDESADTPSTVEDPEIGEDEEVEPEPYVPSGTNSLTGLPMEPEYENNRPVAVMFNNLKEAMPQLGVSQADIIYEIPAEGGINRMLGVFQTLENVGELGSIRSTRPYYLEVALGHDALLVHAGGSPQAYDNIWSWDVDNMDGVRGGSDAKIFWRDPERRKNAGYEHSMLTSGEKILEYLAGDRYRTEHAKDYRYSQDFAQDGTPVNGLPAEYFELYYSYYKTGTFEYDAETGLYMVGQYGGDYIDGNTGEQVGVTNVLVLETDISLISGDTEGRLKVRLTGTGNGTYFCGGKYIPIQWSKDNRNSQFVYTLTDGKPLTLGQGVSYVCIMDSGNSRLTVGQPAE